MLSREEYAVFVSENLSDSECRRLFNVSQAELASGEPTWNEALEYAYNEYAAEEEEAEDLMFIKDEVCTVMPCDMNGVCAGINCTRFNLCNS